MAIGHVAVGECSDVRGVLTLGIDTADDPSIGHGRSHDVGRTATAVQSACGAAGPRPSSPCADHAARGGPGVASTVGNRAPALRHCCSTQARPRSPVHRMCRPMPTARGGAPPAPRRAKPARGRAPASARRRNGGGASGTPAPSPRQGRQHCQKCGGELKIIAAYDPRA